eukprot:3522441-Pleurochrysis_carterae.AAC.2
MLESAREIACSRSVSCHAFTELCAHPYVGGATRSDEAERERESRHDRVPVRRRSTTLASKLSTPRALHRCVSGVLAASHLLQKKRLMLMRARTTPKSISRPPP